MGKKETIWRESWNYLKESSNFVLWAFLIFVFGSVIGFLFPDYFSVFFDKIIKELIDKTSGLNTAELIAYIFQNNLISVFLAIILGAFLGIFPVASILLNGLILGYVMSKAVAVEGWFTIWRLAPHGVFELPAIFISVGLGIKLGLVWFSGKERGKEFKRRLWKSLKVFLVIVLPLLVIAAIIEGFLIALSG